MEKLKQIRQLALNNKYISILILLLAYFESYGSLTLRYFDCIDDYIWSEIHFIGTKLVMLLLAISLKGVIPNLVYALLVGLFTTRFINKILYNSYEFWYEMPISLVLTILIYFALRYVNRKK